MNARISELLSRSKNQNKQISGMLKDHPKSHELKNLTSLSRIFSWINNYIRTRFGFLEG